MRFGICWVRREIARGRMSIVLSGRYFTLDGYNALGRVILGLVNEARHGKRYHVLAGVRRQKMVQRRRRTFVRLQP